MSHRVTESTEGYQSKHW